MARRCVCERLLAMVERDPRLIAAGLAAQMAFVRLMRMAEELGSGGFIPFGSGIRNLGEISLAIGVRETELETALATLIERGVLTRDESGIACPPLREAGRKVAAARANGGLGGRPRKDETPEQARARRQGNLMLPVQGGKPTETENRTLSRAAAATASSSIEASKQPREEPGFIDIGRRVIAAAGIDEASWAGGYAELRGWLNAGLDAETILAVVERVAARPGYKPVRSLRYFTEAMRDAAEASAPVVAVREARPAYMDHPDWAAYQAARDAFHGYGPIPRPTPALAALMAQARQVAA